MKIPSTLIAVGLAAIWIVSLDVHHASIAAAGADDRGAPGGLRSQAECAGEPCDAVARGALAFFDRRLHGLDGNGRSCADCHMPADHFQLSPESADARFRFLQFLRQWNPKADDPLFRPIDADDFRVNGANASDYSNLRQNGLIRVVLSLPPNVRLIDPATNQPSSETVADVWRSVPSVDNVALTGPDAVNNAWFRGPNFFGGYQLDARVATLQEQALGALTNHAEVQAPPPQRLLDDLSSFQRVLFSSRRVGALAEAIRSGAASLPDPDPPLNALEEQGKAVFVRACAQCHGGPNQTSAQAPVVRYQDISTACPRPVDTAVEPRWAFAPCPDRLARNVRTYEFTVGVDTIRRSSSDPGRALLTGFVGGPPPRDDWQKMDMPNLRGLAGTAPYFHNNSAATLEDVVDHYIEFFKRVQALATGAPPPVATTDGVHFDRRPTLEERSALLAYLRKL